MSDSPNPYLSDALQPAPDPEPENTDDLQSYLIEAAERRRKLILAGNFPDKSLSLTLTLKQIENILNGDMTELIAALPMHYLEYFAEALFARL